MHEEDGEREVERKAVPRKGYQVRKDFKPRPRSRDVVKGRWMQLLDVVREDSKVPYALGVSVKGFPVIGVG